MILNKIHHMNCLNYMQSVPDNYFDLILTDPPYGIKQNAHRVKSRTKLAKTTDWGSFDWDNSIPPKEIFDEMKRISQEQIIFGGNYMTKYLKPSSCWIVWDKDNGKSHFADCELAWTSFNTAVRRFKYRWNGMIQEKMNWKEKRVHPTQKPVALGRWILQNYAVKDWKIFDPFAGSGSFLMACKQEGFDFVGCEIQDRFVKEIKKRLKQSTLHLLK